MMVAKVALNKLIWKSSNHYVVRFWSKSQGKALRKGKEDVSGSERGVAAV